MTAGVPAIPLHGARHRYATIMLEDGVPLHVVSAQLGLSNTTTTNIYAHVSPAAATEAAERMANILEGEGSDEQVSRTVRGRTRCPQHHLVPG